MECPLLVGSQLSLQNSSLQSQHSPRRTSLPPILLFHCGRRVLPSWTYSLLSLQKPGIMYPTRLSNTRIGEMTQVVSKHWMPTFTIILISRTSLCGHYGMCVPSTAPAHLEYPLVFKSFNNIWLSPDGVLIHFGIEILTIAVHTSFAMAHTVDFHTLNKRPIVC